MSASAEIDRTRSMNSGERLLVGVSTGNPNSLAAFLTGDSLNESPRPEGRSGCETTRATVSAIDLRVGTAKSEVPKKMVFTQPSDRLHRDASNEEWQDPLCR